MLNTARFVAYGLAIASLAACGGSGGSGSPTPVGLAEITSANATDIAGAVMKATYEGGDLGSFADLSGGVGASVTKSSTVFSKVSDVQISQTKPMLRESQIGTFQAPIAPVETSCEFGGSIVIAGNIRDSDTLTAGDVLTIDFIECDDGLTVVDGTMSMTIRAFSGDFVGGAVSFEVDVELDAFTVDDGTGSQSADGDLTIAMDFPLSGPIGVTVETGNLVLSDGSSSVSLSGFSHALTIDPVTGDYTLIVSGRIGSSAFDGEVEFSTSVGLQGADSEQGFAYTGEVVVTGDANATITIVVLDADFVRLNVDLDGDGAADDVVDVSWEALI